MMAQNNYYEILGVPKNSSQSDIRKAYRKLARKYHPDINPGDKSAEERFKKIQEAYAVLGNAEKRKQYDQGGRFRGQGEAQGFRGFDGFDFGESAGGGWGGFRDIFSDLFGTRTRPPRASRGRDIEHHISVPLLDAVKGTQTRINLNRRAPCAACRSTGSSSGRVTMRSCPSCGGRGQIEQSRGVIRVASPCPQCQGTGTIRMGNCSNCGGTGFIQKVESLRVRIPPDVSSGSRVRLEGKGDAGEAGMPPGDLYLIISVESHPFFRRERNDLVCTVPVTVTEAALGAEIEVPTVDGKARLQIPAGTQSGQKFRLRGRGVSSSRGGGRGSQIVEVKIVLPPIHDERSRELLREFERLNPQNPREKMAP